MAIAQAGSTLQFGINNSANTGTVSSAVTVPADAEIAVVHVSGYGGGTANFLSSGSMTLTKAGADPAMTSFRPGYRVEQISQVGLGRHGHGWR
jgi:alpha-D-ribose 1-methylphosphonate 5-triphosphate synthase subunit PhnG